MNKKTHGIMFIILAFATIFLIPAIPFLFCLLYGIYLLIDHSTDTEEENNGGIKWSLNKNVKNVIQD